MQNQFLLSCESTVDMPYSYVNGRGIPLIFYTYAVDGIEYVDDMGRDPNTLPRFYGFIDEGKLPSTSMLTEIKYVEFFEQLLSQTDLPILHINFGSGMTPSVNNAYSAAKLLKEKYPDRRLEVIDSYCSSSGYGMLVDYAADMRDEGRSIDETIEWVNAHRRNIHHQFFSTELKYFRRSGRMSGATAMLATVLGICPIMRLDVDGKIIAYDKVHGKRNAVKRTVDMMEAHAVDGKDYTGKCFICHSNCIEEAERAKAALVERFPKLSADDIRVFDIGTIIAAHCGPGTVAVFFLGDERAPYPESKE